MRSLDESKLKRYEKSGTVFNAGLLLTSVMFLLRGIIQVLGNYFVVIPSPAVAGLGHLVLGGGLAWILIQTLSLTSQCANTNLRS